MKNKTILISGATGLLGSELVKNLSLKGHSIYVLSTRKKLPLRLAPLVSKLLVWDSQYTIQDSAPLQEVDAVIHLAGANVAAKRWDAAYKEEIINSRTKSTQAIIAAFKKLNHYPEVFISASATGFYGSRGEEILTEDSAKGNGFLSDVCEAWENSVQQAAEIGSRRVSFRLGIILSKRGGALPKMLPPFYFFVGGTLGTGRQWFSWVSLDDAVAVFERAVEETEFNGIYNVVAPVPVRMYDLAKSIGTALRRPYIFPVPEFILKLFLGESAIELTKSQRVIPKRLLEMQFEFSLPALFPAIKEMIENGK